MSKTQAEVTHWMQQLCAEGALYVWGMNGDVISRGTIDRARNIFRSAAYGDAYYDAKLAAGKGKHGADCSGAFYPMRGADASAQGYYDTCTVKGAVANMPTGVACLVFGGSSVVSINHVGWYCGDGYVIEMRNSTANCTRALLSSRAAFKWFGLPPWVSDYSDATAIDSSDRYIRQFQRWLNGYVSTGLLVDGVCGSRTRAAAMKALQVALGVANSGQFDAATREALAKHNLKRGDSGHGVYVLQGLLYCNGLDPRGLDGSFGPGCDAALRQYQTARGLSVDGVAGNGTFAALLA